MGTKTRPLQLALASQLLREKCVAVGIVAGDMNAIDRHDLTLPSQEDIQLRDVWAEYTGEETALSVDSENLGPKEEQSENDGKESNWGEENGHTWGYQSGKTIFHPRRMDKILFRVNEGAKVWLEPVKGGKVDRLGVNVDVKIDCEQRPGEEDEYLPISDHFGLITRFIVVASEKQDDPASLQ